jgi:hypothetical protein
MPVSGPFAQLAALLCLAAAPLPGQASASPEHWTPMFDGKSLQGWKPQSASGSPGVRVQDNYILIGQGRLTGITWSSDFPASNYEIRYEAARLAGNDFFASPTFPVNTTFCSWINGGWGGTVVGLSSLDFDDASENDTSTIHDFVPGRWYSFRLAVTTNRIRAWIDSQLIIDAGITGRRVSLRADDSGLFTPLGFSSYSTLTGLRKIEYRRLPAGLPQ